LIDKSLYEQAGEDTLSQLDSALKIKKKITIKTKDKQNILSTKTLIDDASENSSSNLHNSDFKN
jgi:hypothetical protein